MICAVHVDDFLSIASSKEENERFKSQMKLVWSISDLGEAKHCIGIAIQRDKPKRAVYLSQKALIDKIIQQFGQQDSHPVSTPMDAGLKLRRVDKSTLPQSETERLAPLSITRRLSHLLGGWNTSRYIICRSTTLAIPRLLYPESLGSRSTCRTSGKGGLVLEKPRLL